MHEYTYGWGVHLCEISALARGNFPSFLALLLSIRRLIHSRTACATISGGRALSFLFFLLFTGVQQDYHRVAGSGVFKAA